MSLVQTARMIGHDPSASLKDVLTRQPTHRARRMQELQPHHCQAASVCSISGGPAKVNLCLQRAYVTSTLRPVFVRPIHPVHIQGVILAPSPEGE